MRKTHTGIERRSATHCDCPGGDRHNTSMGHYGEARPACRGRLPPPPPTHPPTPNHPPQLQKPLDPHLRPPPATESPSARPGRSTADPNVLSRSGFPRR